MDIKLLKSCDTCSDCHKVNMGIMNSLRMLIGGDYRGFGALEFYFRTIDEYPSGSGDDIEHFREYCPGCGQKSILDKSFFRNMAKEFREIESCMECLSDDDKRLVLIEMRNSPYMIKLNDTYFT